MLQVPVPTPNRHPAASPPATRPADALSVGDLEGIVSRSNRLAATVAPRLIGRLPTGLVFGIGLVVCGAPAIGVADEPAAPSSAVAAGTSEVRSFFTRHCVDCHGADEAKGGLRLDTLSADLAATGTAKTWTKVLDRLASGEMPPQDSPRPPAAEMNQVREWIHHRLLAEDSRTRPADGALTLRRLNRVQYENTIRDLLSIDLELQDRLPVDGRALGFDNVGSALSLSSAQLEAYLDAADAALDAAIVTKPKPVGVKSRISGLQALGEIHVRRNGAIQELEDAAIGYGRLQFYASRDAAPEDGTYRVRCSMFGHQSQGKPVEVYCRSMHKTGDDVIGYFQIKPDVPEVLDIRVKLKKDARVTFNTLKFRYVPRKRVAAEHTDPGLGIQWIEFEGPLLDQWPPKGHTTLFGDLPIVMVSEYHKRMSVKSEQPQADAERLLRSFMRRAYRRPVTAADVEPMLALVTAHLAENEQSAKEGRAKKGPAKKGPPANDTSFEEAMRVGYKAVLCSPDFLFFQEKNRQPDDFSLASRLSYFLWNTLPDDELLDLAERGELSRPATLHAQVERLLNDPRSEQFAANFLGQWLDLRLIDFTTPDPKLYPEFDTALREAMLAETELFFQELLKKNLSVLEFIDSDFTFLNERLATHYGIDGVAGTEMRRVALPAGSRRGGVMTMASVLKVTANGSYTHPVHRGVWVMRNILGTPPEPPPPNAGAVEPDLRGLQTIRAQLDVHRRDQACAGCHVKIDPLGFALENFDVAGGWREKYRVLSGERLSLDKNGPPVEAAYELPDGRKFQDIDELKALLLTNQDQLARCVAEKLLVYATGRGLRFSDRAAVDAILAQSRAEKYGLRNMIHRIVESPVFLNDEAKR
jgi:mono/diheme cytochrome c family protein